MRYAVSSSGACRSTAATLHPREEVGDVKQREVDLLVELGQMRGAQPAQRHCESRAVEDGGGAAPRDASEDTRDRGLANGRERLLVGGCEELGQHPVH